jgi:hypothetical protein
MSAPILDDAIVQVQTYLAALPGIRQAPAYPTDSAPVFPFVISRPGQGTWEFGPDGTKKGLHNIVIELHVARSDLARDVRQINPFCDSIPNLLFSKLINDNKWNGKISTFRSITYRYMTWDWGNNLMTIGIEFTVNEVKMQNAIT